jgi:cyclopropane-fatty-acyl-phospholipid synthase
MEKYGLDARAIENLSYHYQRSVEQWLKNFETHWERIHAIDPVRFNEKFRRTWLFYLGARPKPSRPHARSSIATT